MQKISEERATYQKLLIRHRNEHRRTFNLGRRKDHSLRLATLVSSLIFL